MERLIESLSNLRGISGFEYRMSDKIVECFKEYVGDIRIDTLGNVIALKKCGKENAKKIMIEAHIDEIGLMVKDIDDRGFITFVPVGGVDSRILPSLEVVVHGKYDLPGVIGSKPPHLQESGEQDKSTKIEDMAIDVGFSAKKVKELVSIGDSITFAQSVGKLGDNEFSGKTLDDRAGVAALIMTMKNLMKIKTEADIYAVAAVQEEVGLRGAKTAAYGIEPDIAIAVDVCHGITPDNSYNAFETGAGVVISVGPNIHTKLQKKLVETAERYHIKYEIDVDGGDTGTDAWAIQVSRCGVPTALLSIPLKYMHTSVETLDIRDVKAVSELLTCFIQNIDENPEGWLCL